MEIWYTLTGDIDKNIVNSAISWINSQIYSNDVSNLNFIISSNGGDMDSAIRLHDYLKALPIEVQTVGFGQVDSAAITIFLAGKKRLAVKNCRFIIHEGSFFTATPSAPLHIHEENIQLFKNLLSRTIDIVSEDTGKTKKEIKKLVNKGKTLNTDEAKKIGIVTKIVEKLPLVQQLSNGKQITK